MCSSSHSDFAATWSMAKGARDFDPDDREGKGR